MTDANVYYLGRRAFDDRPPHHPALRWLVGDAPGAHRRRDRATVCGRDGEMILAGRDDPLCGECFPRTG